ncbi:MAG: hypothetical protein OZ948_05395 [Deltaproteobacteria bacterium]|nr:hypothetical protein [Deltaproteobacteria bacterium]
MYRWLLTPSSSLLLLLIAAGLPASPVQASSIRLADPSPFLFGVPGGLPASVVVHYAPASDGDLGLDGSAALFDPDDIGFGVEPDSQLAVALGTGGGIELAFERTVTSDGIRSAGPSLEGAELFFFEDGGLDGASFRGRLASGALLLLGSLDELIIFSADTPGFGPDARDTLIAIDLDRLDLGPLELVSVLVHDDGFTPGLDSFELDAVVNLSPGRPTPALAPEPGTLGLLALGLLALPAVQTRGRRPRRPGRWPSTSVARASGGPQAVGIRGSTSAVVV